MVPFQNFKYRPNPIYLTSHGGFYGYLQLQSQTALSVFKSLAKETLIYGLSYSAGRVINFLLITSYLTYRIFTREDGYFSIYQDLYFYIGLLLSVLTLRMETTFFRFASDENYGPGIYPLVSRLVWILSLFFLVLVFLFRAELLDFLKYGDDLGPHLMLASGILVLDVVVSLPFAKLRYDKKPVRYAWIKLSSLITNIAAVLFIFEGMKWLGSGFDPARLSSQEKLYYVLLANFISSSLNLLLLLREILPSLTQADWSPVKKILAYSWPLVVVTLSFTIIQSGYTSYLKYLLSDDPASNLKASDSLNAAYRLAVIMNIFLTAFQYAAEPFFFRHSRQTDARRHFAALSLVFIICCSGIYLATTLNLDLFSRLLGPGFRGSLYLVPILLMANIFSGLYYNLGAWNKLTDKTKMAAGISLTGLLVNTVLYLILVPVMGVEASAWIMLIVYFLMCVLSYFQGQKHYPIPYDLGTMVLVLIGSVLISALTRSLLPEGLVLRFLISNFVLLISLFGLFKLILKAVRSEQSGAESGK